MSIKGNHPQTMTPADSPSRLVVLMFTDLVGSVDLGDVAELFFVVVVAL